MPYNSYMPYMPYYNQGIQQQMYQQQVQQPQVQPQQYQMQQAQYQNYVAQPQQTFIPLTFVNGIEGAKTYILSANSKVFLKDSDSDILFEKSADHEGKYTIVAYRTTPIKIEDIGKKVEEPKQPQYLEKGDLREFVTKNDFKALREEFLDGLNNLSSSFENAFKSLKNSPNKQNGGNR